MRVRLVKDGFRAYGLRSNLAVGKATSSVGEATAAAAQRNAPKRTGDLAASVHVAKVSPRGDGWRAEIVADAKHGLPQEVGTKTGTPATHFMRRALRSGRRRFRPTLKALMP